MDTRPDILLCPNVPKPLHGLNPRSIMGQDWWDEKRHEAYKLSNFTCQACGTPKQKAEFHNWLEAHELYDYNYEEGIAYLKEIVALCHRCHNYIHNGRLEVIFQKDEIPFSKFSYIIKTGSKILCDNGLPYNLFAFAAAKRNNIVLPKNPHGVQYAPSVDTAEWGKWRLVLDGKEFKGKFADMEEWRSAYSVK